MKAIVYHGPEDVRFEDRPDPVLAAPKDAIVRVTTAALCGSDLHLYHGDIPDMHEGDVLGHEFVGIIEQVGDDVRNVQPGDRVVVSGLIADGECWYCKQGQFSLCDATNPNPAVQEMYGQSIAGVFGYSHLTGGFDGGQAEYVRVPFADVNTMKLPEDVRDDQAVMLSDVMCTGWHANELSETREGDTVAVFGCGPVGLLAMEAARYRGIAQMYAVDNIPYRLEIARSRFGAVVINYDENDPVKTLRELTYGRGPDVCMETAGFRYSRTLRHRVQRKLKLETDAIDALSDAIRAVRKGGRLSIIGDFIGFANQFPVGALMEKGLTVRGGQVNVQRYWHNLLDLIRAGDIDPTFVITHRWPLERAPEAYRVFDKKEDGAVKFLFDTARPEPSKERELAEEPVGVI
ncbi:MAG TPA: zinc-dependent alcohol dehydrogenase [Dehalococcoidia bacterium]|jgi:threonine dehydrogenase-like Zn-dependent dehydrogenase|nr:zinc-dependent alcohol dehydrogenase [Dehalococcoidia bacterium]